MPKRQRAETVAAPREEREQQRDEGEVEGGLEKGIRRTYSSRCTSQMREQEGGHSE